MRRLPPLLIALAAAAVAAPAAPAQSAKSVINDMMAQYEKRMAGIDGYTLVQNAMGFDMTMRFEKEMVDGRPVYRLRESTIAGRTAPRGNDEDDFDLYGELPKIAERATYKGRETVDGQAVHVIAVDDLQEIRFGRGVMPQNAEFEPRSATMFVDTKLSVPRRMILEGKMTMQGKTSDVTATVDLQDYREVEGMLHPFHTLMAIEGLGQAVDPETRKQYEEMKKQLADMPESQRAMVEQMMKGRMEQMEQMMGGGPMNIELTVKELRVNR